MSDDNFSDSFYEDEISREPRFNDSDSLQVRLNPKELLEGFKLKIMGLYKATKTVKLDDGSFKEVVIIRGRKETKPLVNKQGAEEIIGFIESAVNKDTVMGNFIDKVEYNHRLKYIARDLAKTFIAKRKEWDASLTNINYLIDSSIIVIELFLTRPIANEERRGLGETYKETRHQDMKPTEKKNLLEKMQQMMR